jgi:hypothetical protein
VLSTYPISPSAFLVQHTSKLGGIFRVVLIEAELFEALIVYRVYLPDTTINGAVSVLVVYGVRL